MTVSHPVLRYYGAKWRLANWIIRNTPPHSCYVEPFGGSAAVLLRKEPSNLEVYNDMDGDVVNFFRVLREDFSALERSLLFTPYAREEFLGSYAVAADSTERARRFFIRSWQGFGGPTRRRLTGWKVQKRTWISGRADVIKEWSRAADLESAAMRFKNVQLEQQDALDVIRRFDTPETFFYIDPPYPSNTRNQRWAKDGYAVDIAGDYHEHLANLLHIIKGTAIISSYPNGSYDELFKGWTRLEKTTQTMNGTNALELLYLHPRIA